MSAKRHLHPVPIPPYRKLRGYAFDPSLSIQLETAFINETVFKINWEEPEEEDAGTSTKNEAQLTMTGEEYKGPSRLGIGPVGEYIEVIDYDPASRCFYEPVNLNDPLILAQDGLPPSEGNPQFHQQMVYAVAMTTIQNFEHALGRRAFWSPYNPEEHDTQTAETIKKEKYVQRLRIYPHALREANAYYSPAKKALLFGYFPTPYNQPGEQYPGGTVFTCLSHDIIAHETTHALLDGMHRRFSEPTHPDVLAFHEAFADVVALFQHFSFPEVLRHQISKTKGNLSDQSLLGELAQQFGRAIGHYGALRNAIGQVNQHNQWERLKPDPNDYLTVFEPHDRGAILVAAVFDAFLAIYKRRIADLLRIATSGTGILPSGEIHPDLVNRLANEAAKSAKHVLNMCIRALDYCPPVDLTFGDYLRAIITADIDLVADDDLGYRVAFIEAFRRRGIYPLDLRTLSEDSLCWDVVRMEDEKSRKGFEMIAIALQDKVEKIKYHRTREQSFYFARDLRRDIHNSLKQKLSAGQQFDELTGLDTTNRLGTTELLNERKEPIFEVHAVRLAQRVGPDGNSLNQVVLSITQKRKIQIDDNNPEEGTFIFRGGCTMIIDLNKSQLRYCIKKDIIDDERLRRQRRYVRSRLDSSLSAVYFGEETDKEPFAVLHRAHRG